MLLLGEEVAQRPSTLLSLRGIDLEDLVGLADCKIGGLEDCGIERNNHPITQSPNHPISQSPNLSILRRLGPIPFWRGTARCVDALTRIYSRCQPVAADAANGKSIDLRN